MISINKSLSLLAATLLFIAIAEPSFAQNTRAEAQEATGLENNCNWEECFGIVWRTPIYSKVRLLNPNQQSIEGKRPIHYAAANCSPQATLEDLHRRGADLNLVEPTTGLFPIQIAMRVCRLPTIRTLLRLGANPNVLDPKTSATLLHYAFESDRSNQFLKALIDSNIDINAQDQHGQTALILAMLDNNTSIVSYLLDAGADPEVSDSRGSRIVHYAAVTQDTDLLRKLQSLNANFNAAMHDGRTALHILAAQNITPKIVAIFKTRGADPNIIDNEGLAPIHYAAAQTPIESVVALLLLGVDTDYPDAKGETALHYALRYNSDPRVVPKLLLLGADATKLTADGLSPALLAVRYQDDFNILSTLIDYGADIADTDSKGLNLLHHAILANNQKMVTKLLDAGADPFTEDILGRSGFVLADLVELENPANARLESIILQKREADKQAYEAEKEFLANRQDASDQAKQLRDAKAAELKAQQDLVKYQQDFKQESVGEHKLKQVEKDIAQAQKQLKNFKNAGNEKQTARFQEKVDDLTGKKTGVQEQLALIRKSSKKRSEKPLTAQQKATAKRKAQRANN